MPAENEKREQGGYRSALRPSMLRIAALIAAAGVLGGIGCQLLLSDDSTTQCSTNGDCAARGFSFAVCGPDGTCINPTDFCTTNGDCPPRAEFDALCVQNKCSYTPSNFCNTSDECAKYFDGAPARCVNNRCEAYPPNHCFKNTDCITKANGAPAVCIQEACQNLLSDDCSFIVGNQTDYEQDDVVIFGFLMNIQGSGTNAVGLGSLGAVILGRNHFYQTFRGLPGPTPNSKPRPFIYLVCNEFVDATRAANHLIKDLKVQAILGPELSDSTYTLGRTVTSPAGVLILTPASTTGALGTLKNGLTFRNFGTDDDFLPIYQQIISKKETALNTAGTVVGDTLKVGIFHKGETGGTYLAQNLTKSLVFNGGKSGTDNLNNNPPYLQLFDYGYAPGMSQAQSDQKTAAAITSLLAYQPHIIFLPGTGELFAAMQSIESQWPAAATYRPLYIPYSAAVGFAWRDWVGTNANLRSRILFASHQVPTPGDTVGAQVQAQGQLEFDQAFVGGFRLDYFSTDGGAVGDGGDSGLPPGTRMTSGTHLSSYDNGHLLPLAAVHATVAADGGPITGAAIAAGLNSFGPGGSPVALTGSPQGPLSDGVANLQKGAKVQYHGVNGIIKFDSTGTTHAPVGMRCIGTAPANATTAAGVFYDSNTGQITGTCGGPCAPTVDGGACSP